MQDPAATRAIIRYRGERLSQIKEVQCLDLASNNTWVSFVAQVAVAPDQMMPRLFYVPIEWVIEIEVLP